MRVALYHARLILLLMLLALAMPARAASQAVRIGVLAFQGKDQAFAQWSATAGYLTEAVADATGANTRSKQELKEPSRRGLRDSFV